MGAWSKHLRQSLSRKCRSCTKSFDEAVEAFRPACSMPPRIFAADALVLKVRRGRPRRRGTLIATGVNAEGYREILGIQVTSAEDGPAGWRSSATWSSGVALVTQRRPRRPGGRDHATLPAAAWQRCRTHLRSQSDGAAPAPPGRCAPCRIPSTTSLTPNRCWPNMISTHRPDDKFRGGRALRHLPAPT